MDGEDFADMTLFRCVGAQELSPRGNVAEEVSHLDQGARRASGGAHFGEDAGVDLDECAFVVIGAACRQREA